MLAMQMKGRFVENDVVTLVRVPAEFQGGIWAKAAGKGSMFVVCLEVLSEYQRGCACT